MIRAVVLVTPLVLAACAGTPSQRSCADAPPVQTNVGGEAVMGVGSGGFVAGGQNIVFSTRVTPGGSGCTSVGGSIGR